MRPDACNGCPCCPGSAGYDPKKSGAFVPPIGPSGSITDPYTLSSTDLADVDLVIIGMAPSYREVDAGEPLVGPSFVEMRRGLGPMLDTVVLLKMNYVNCRTWKPGRTVDYINRDPSAVEAKMCSVRWLVPILRAMAEAERRGANIHLWVLGQKAFDVVFQGKYGTFGGSKGSRGQRMNRRLESYDILADRIERWTTKETRKKTRFCKDCNQPLTVPRVRLCFACRSLSSSERKRLLGEAKSLRLPQGALENPKLGSSANPLQPSSTSPNGQPEPSSLSPQEHPLDEPASRRQLELPGCSSRPLNQESDGS